MAEGKDKDTRMCRLVGIGCCSRFADCFKQEVLV